MSGYEHAGGFQSALTTRTLILTVALIGALLVGQMLLGPAYGRGTANALFHVVIASFIVFHGARDILDTEKRREATGSEKSLRSIRVGGIIVLMLGTAVGTSAIATLIEAWRGQ